MRFHLECSRTVLMLWLLQGVESNQCHDCPHLGVGEDRQASFGPLNAEAWQSLELLWSHAHCFGNYYPQKGASPRQVAIPL